MDRLITDARELLKGEFEEHRRVLVASERDLAGPFTDLVDACGAALQGSGKLMLFGNGGSAADAQHLAAEFVVRLSAERAALAALALTTDTSALTAIGNDFGFDRIFERQVEALARPGDVAIGISTSGNSPNVLLGLQMARRLGCVAAGLTGADGGKMNDCANPLLKVPSSTTARIQEVHILIGHALCRAVENRLRRPARA